MPPTGVRCGYFFAPGRVEVHRFRDGVGVFEARAGVKEDHTILRT
jgi:hypothetical protein